MLTYTRSANASRLVPMDGNAAASHVAYHMSEAAFLYPITPSSVMGELYDNWASEKKKNVWNRVPIVRVLQSEAGAAGALHGAASSGAFTTTFTASQGLLLMLPNMLKTAGELWPTVFHIAARAVSTQALSIQGDHSDVMLTRSSGFAHLSSSTVQECMDHAAIAHMSTIESEIPFVHFFDGFRLSHQIDSISPLTYDEMCTLTPYAKLEEIRSRALNPAHPIVLGHSQGADAYFQTVELGNKYYDKIPSIVEANMSKFQHITGRRYRLFDYFGAPNAEDVIVVMGAAAPTVKEASILLENTGKHIGVVIPHLYRPWSIDHFIAALPSSTKRITVLDRSKDPSIDAEPLLMDVILSLNRKNHPAKVFGGRFGLASTEFTPPHVQAVLNNMQSKNPHYHFTVGVKDDVTGLSLPPTPLPGFGNPYGVYRVIFWGLGGDGTVGANKSAIKAAIDQKGMFGQGYFAYSADKSNGLTRSFLRFSNHPIYSQYNIVNADFVGCTLPSYVHTYPLCDKLAEGGTFFLNIPYDNVDSLDKNLPANIKRQLAKKRARLFVVDATGIAEECGLSGKISTIVQACFYKISGILGTNSADATNKWIDNEFGRLGKDIVEKNKKMAEISTQRLKEIKIPDEWKNAIDPPGRFLKRSQISFENEEMCDPHVDPDYIHDIVEPVNRLAGASLPVSKFKYNIGGVSPVGITKYLKKGLTLKVPKWDSQKCVQCNTCSLLCPHSVIRPYVLSPEEKAKVPLQIKKNMTTIPTKGVPEYNGFNYRIQVSPYDCIGCEVCIVHCPTRALEMTEISSEKGIQYGREQNDMFLWLDNEKNVENKANLLKDRTTLKNSQFNKPLLEFPGSCAGCTETQVTKLVTQLFGPRMICANASGCSSVWGGSFPKVPFTTDKNGRGPAWARSLFEDNAEYGYGMANGLQMRRDGLRIRVEKTLNNRTIEIDTETRSVLTDWLANYNNGEQTLKLLPELLERTKRYKHFTSYKNASDLWVKPSHWILGGDGWAYDIGFGGLDHIMASKSDFNILVFDNEVYSNTGGQQSKATNIGAVAQFASSGKETPKKDLGFMMMNYGNVYVASVSMATPESQKHLNKCLLEAESFPGPSLILCYCNCILHHIKGSVGAGGKGGMEAERLAVESGYWPLYSFDPRRQDKGTNPLEILSKTPDNQKLQKFLDMEVRYNSLKRVNPQHAGEMLKSLWESIDLRYKKYQAYKSVFDKK